VSHPAERGSQGEHQRESFPEFGGFTTKVTHRRICYVYAPRRVEKEKNPCDTGFGHQNSPDQRINRPN